MVMVVTDESCLVEGPAFVNSRRRLSSIALEALEIPAPQS
jgi:hypothetical protein